MVRAYRALAALAVFLTLGLGSAFAGVTIGQVGYFDARGWTQITPSVDTVVAYVSNSGNDANPCTYAAPCLTAAKAMSLTTNGHPDWILFHDTETIYVGNSGDIANNAWGTPGCFLGRNGRSSTEPFVISDYSDTNVSPSNPRGDRVSAPPIIRFWDSGTGSDCGAFIWGGLNNVAVVGLTLYAYKQDPSNNPGEYCSSCADVGGIINVVTGTDWMLVEDVRCASCYELFYNIPTLYYRRNIVDWFHVIGVQFQTITTLHMEENIFYHNGWNRGDPLNTFNHNVYGQFDVTHSGTPETWYYIGNGSYAAADTALRMREMGLAWANLCSESQTCLEFNDTGPPQINGIQPQMLDNVSTQLQWNNMAGGLGCYYVSAPSSAGAQTVNLQRNICGPYTAQAIFDGLTSFSLGAFSPFVVPAQMDDTNIDMSGSHFSATTGNTLINGGPRQTCPGCDITRNVTTYATTVLGLLDLDTFYANSITRTRQYNYDQNYYPNNVANWIRTGYNAPLVNFVAASGSTNGGHSWLGRFGMLKPANDNIAERLRKLSAANDNLPLSVFKKVARR